MKKPTIMPMNRIRNKRDVDQTHGLDGALAAPSSSLAASAQQDMRRKGIAENSLLIVLLGARAKMEEVFDFLILS
jgi:hypothetical protein